MSFSENLQFLRDRAGLTQEQLAERLEVSRQSVSKWESAASYPEMEKLLLMCDLFHTDLDTLLRGDARESCHDQSLKAPSRRKRINRGRVFSIIVLVATVLYLAVGFGLMIAGSSLGWKWGWIVYPISLVLCGIAAVS